MSNETADKRDGKTYNGDELANTLFLHERRIDVHLVIHIGHVTIQLLKRSVILQPLVLLNHNVPQRLRPCEH